MGIGLFKAGQHFDLDGKRQKITRLLDKERIEFEDAQSSRRQELTRSEALDLYNSGNFVFRPIVNVEPDKRARSRVMSNTLLASVPPLLRDLAKLRLHFVTKLAHFPTTRARLTPLVQALWEKLKTADRALMPECPHASSVARWMKQYRDAENNIVALLDQHALKGHRDRIPQKVLDLMEDCVRDGYLTPHRRNITSVLSDINGLIDDTNLMLTPSEQLSPISYEQLRKYISKLPAYEVYAARYGEQAADMKFRNTGKGASAALPLQRAEMDHCRLDLFVVDMETGLPLGRPWLTVIIDACTRMILGFSLSFDAPSSLTVMRALRHAVLPKTDLDDVTQPWPTWGIMRILTVDNGVEFHGSSLDYAAGQFGITIQTCPSPFGPLYSPTLPGLPRTWRQRRRSVRVMHRTASMEQVFMRSLRTADAGLRGMRRLPAAASRADAHPGGVRIRLSAGPVGPALQVPPRPGRRAPDGGADGRCPRFRPKAGGDRARAAACTAPARKGLRPGAGTRPPAGHCTRPCPSSGPVATHTVDTGAVGTGRRTAAAQPRPSIHRTRHCITARSCGAGRRRDDHRRDLARRRARAAQGRRATRGCVGLRARAVTGTPQVRARRWP